MIEGGHQYQWLTAYDRRRMEGHRLDWPGQPAFFKNYAPCNTYSLPLPESFPQSSLFPLPDKFSSANKVPSKSPTPIIWNRSSLATLLLLTSAPTARSTFAEGELWYRSNASAGALHPLEFYISFPGSDDLPAGLYHYDLLKPGLNRLRQDPALETFAVTCGAGKDEEIFSPTLVVSGIFFRSAWKYRERAYRYLLLDAGHALENLSLALLAMGADFEIVLDFDDAVINRVSGFDEEREVALLTVRLCSRSAIVEGDLMLEAGDPEPELACSSKVSDREVDYLLLHEIHKASSTPMLRVVDHSQLRPQFYEKLSNWQKISEPRDLPEPALDYVESLLKRRSRRNFSKSSTPLDLQSLHSLLGLMAQTLGYSSLPEPEVAFWAAGFLELTDGFYVFDRNAGCFALLADGDRRREVAAASLDQRWLENAALQFLFFADLESAQEVFGPRSYRNLKVAAGRLGQRLYLGATALNLGCCAVGAFYDRELAQACSLPQNYDPLYLVAVGPVAGNG